MMSGLHHSVFYDSYDIHVDMNSPSGVAHGNGLAGIGDVRL